MTDVRVGGREYALALAILLGVTLPSLVLTVATGTRSADAPSWGQLIGFLAAFFALQLATTAAARAAPATVLVRSVPVTTMTASSARKIPLTPATH